MVCSVLQVLVKRRSLLLCLPNCTADHSYVCKHHSFWICCEEDNTTSELWKSDTIKKSACQFAQGNNEIVHVSWTNLDYWAGCLDKCWHSCPVDLYNFCKLPRKLHFPLAESSFSTRNCKAQEICFQRWWQFRHFIFHLAPGENQTRLTQQMGQRENFAQENLFKISP